MDFWTLLLELTSTKDCNPAYMHRITDVMIESHQIPASKMGELYYQLGMTYTKNACPAEAEQAFRSAEILAQDTLILQKAQAELARLRGQAKPAE